jgi:hypothetical protein
MLINTDNTTVTFGPAVAIHGGVLGSSLSPTTSRFVFQGMLIGDDYSPLLLDGNWTSSGTFQISGTGGGFDFRGNGTLSNASAQTTGTAMGHLYLEGTIINTGSTLTLIGNTALEMSSGFSSGGTFIGGTITGGVVTTSYFPLPGANPTLDGVTLNCDLHVASLISHQGLTVVDGLTLNGTMFLGGPGSPGMVYFQETQVLDGTGNIVFVDVNSPFGNNSLTVTTENTTVTLGAALTVHGKNGVLESQFPTSTFVNDGTIAADTLGGTIALTASNWTNNGIVQALNGGTLSATTPTNYASGTLTGGTWQVFAGSTLRVAMSSGIVTNAAAILVDGAISNFYADSGTTDALANFTGNGAPAAFTIQNGRSLTIAGALSNMGNVTVGSSSALNTGGAYTQAGGTTTLNGGSLTAGGLVDIQGGILSGSGTINGSVRNAGQIDVGGAMAAGLLTINGDYTQTAAGVLNIEIGGTRPGVDYDRLAISGTATLDGTLNVSLIDPFVPASGATFQILTFGSSSGMFAFPNIDPHFLPLRYDPTDVTLTAV